MNSIGSLFGTAAVAALPTEDVIAESDVFNPEEFADNPAFASDSEETNVHENGNDARYEEPHTEPEQERNWFDPDPPQQTSPQEQVPTGCACDNCGAKIDDRVYEYSLSRFGRPLCMKCQRGAGR
jgi:hypothetical protein